MTVHTTQAVNCSRKKGKAKVVTLARNKIRLIFLAYHFGLRCEFVEVAHCRRQLDVVGSGVLAAS